ncbi:MAG: hypothetical protein H6705_02615 [Myxococcales bacterium]|nr:hypothetical protein [Myxococcales bacterium]
MNDAHGITTMMVAMLREGYGFGHWIQRKMTGQVLRAIFTQSFKGYASLEAQFAVADLLFHARAGLRAVLRELLATWLLDNQQSIRWSHFFEAAWVERVGDIKTIPDEPLVLASRVSDPLKALEYFVPRHWCGPFLASLHHIVVRYDIDPVLVAGPLLDSPDWRLRLIGNLVQRPPRTITEFDALLDRIWPDLEQRPPVYRLTP